MNDKPEAEELLEAIAAFLDEDVVPVLAGSKRFHALVAANVARILARERKLGPARLAWEERALSALLGRGPRAAEPAAASPDTVEELSQELCRRILAGEADAGPWATEVRNYLRESTLHRLEIDNPRFRR